MYATETPSIQALSGEKNRALGINTVTSHYVAWTRCQGDKNMTHCNRMHRHYLMKTCAYRQAIACMRKNTKCWQLWDCTESKQTHCLTMLKNNAHG